MVNLKDLLLRRTRPEPLPTLAELDAAFASQNFASRPFAA